jgi:cell filamentation protein, protein adenylyltransferase
MAFDPKVPYNDLPPLPPRAEIETKAVLKKVASAGRSLAELKGLGATIPNQSILVNSLVLREAKASSEIENIVTTNDALYKAFTASSSQVDPATKEVLQYRVALWEGFIELKKRGLMTTNLFIQMVQTIVQTQAGIRVLPGTVIQNTKTGEVLYTPPLGETVIREKLKNLEEYIHGKDETDPLIKLAIIHYQFEAIHPFSDGNGRTGRIINSLYLVYTELLDLPVLYLSKYIIENKSEYYTLLRAVTSKGEWEKWVLYMLDGVEKTAAETRNKIVAIRSLIDQTLESGKKKIPSKVYSKELIELLFHQPYTKAQLLVDAGIAERKTAAVYLRELEKAGILRSKKSGKEMLFLNVKLFQLLSK